MHNPIADVHATLELGRIFLNGPLATITQTMEQLLDKAGRGEISQSFLAVIGMPEDGLERAADIATKNPYWNPRDFTREDILGLLKAAFAGERPRCNA